ncbi:MAG TPA: TlyA family RNA methyltransferase [Actinomycetota bacterium]|nr:TlyA family RNA methyltransferase [Actinomycetota bacterium]
MAKPTRLDAELVRRGLVRSRGEAGDAIAAGDVLVNGVPVDRAATMVAPDVSVALRKRPRRFVSRGGDKLEGALHDLDVEVAGRRWLDAGASTGGFTDCLLRRGAAEVVAVDVGYGQFDWGLRNDERVLVMERLNVRDLRREDLPWSPDAVVADLSFISLRLVIPALAGVAREDADLLVLVKPQFEVGRSRVGKGGVVRDPALWRQAIDAVAGAAAAVDLGVAGATASPLPGPAGNREFFLHLRRGTAGGDQVIAAAIDRAPTT